MGMKVKNWGNKSPMAPRRRRVEPLAHDDFVLERARRFFTAFDDPESLKLFAERVEQIRQQALQHAATVEEQLLADRVAAFEALYELPGLLRRVELFEDPRFSWILDGLFRTFQQRDREVPRRLSRRKPGHPPGDSDALETLSLVERALTLRNDHREWLEAIRDTDDEQISASAREAAAVKRWTAR